MIEKKQIDASSEGITSNTGVSEEEVKVTKVAEIPKDHPMVRRMSTLFNWKEVELG